MNSLPRLTGKGGSNGLVGHPSLTGGLSATVGLGPHHAAAKAPAQKSLAKVLQEHDAINNPHLVAAGQDTTKALPRRYKPAYPGEKPAGYEPLPQYGKFGQKFGPQKRPYYQVQPYKGSNLEFAVDQQVTPTLAKGSKFANPSLTIPATIAGTALTQLSGGPAALAAAHAIRKGKLGTAAFDAASLLPIGRLGKALRGAKAGAEAAKTAEETVQAAHLTEEAAKIRGAISGQTGRDALKSMGEYERLGALVDNPNIGKSVRQIRKEQDVLRSGQRSKNVAAGENALNRGHGMASFHAALKEHQGPLPKIQFSGFGDLTPANLDNAAEAIKRSNLMHYQKLRVAKSLEAAVHEGTTPTPSDLTLIEHVFGKDVNGTLHNHEHLGAFAKATEILNIPRTIMSSFDLSAPFRQGLVMMGRHPIISAKNFGPMAKAFGSEKVYRQGMQEIVGRQNFPTYQAMKLNLTDFEHGLPGMEEAFIGKNYAEKIPGIGHVIRGSGRAYTLYLNKTRADVADQLLRYAKDSGINIERQVPAPRVFGKQIAPRPKDFLTSLGKYINAGTGRGTYDVKAVEQSLPLLNALMFSPRLLASRLNFLNPYWYAKLDPFVRKQALRAAFQTLGAGMTVLTLAHEAGAKVGLDPTSADFGKIRIGNTRIDIWGGFQQPVRLLAQLYAGHVTSSTTGKTLNLGPEGPGKLSRFDIGLRFGESKLGPIPGAVLDVSRGQNQVGQPLDWSFRHGNHFNWNSPYAQRLLPLLVQDAHDLASQHHNGMNGLEAALAGYGVGMFGVGVQTYGPKQNGAKPTGPSVTPAFAGPSLGGSSSLPSSSQVPPLVSGESSSSSSGLPRLTGGKR